MEPRTYLDTSYITKKKRVIPCSPRVTVGIPVYNGENYLDQAINSILGQTFADLELVISDNASTDGTEDICRTYEAQDDRVRYVRNAVNLGASKNFNHLVHMARGEYFKWAAHDDVCAPDLLQRCVSVLDADDSIILCYSLSLAIDENGDFLMHFAAQPNLNSTQPHKRFIECICKYPDQNAVFGLIRTDILKKTKMIGNFPSSDRALLGELTLLGRFYEIPEYLLFKRHHPEQHWRVYNSNRDKQIWYDPAKADVRVFRTWRLLQEHLKTIDRAPLNRSERAKCYLSMGLWVRYNWRKLLNDFITDRKRVL